MAECCHRVPNSQTPTVLALTPSLFTANEKGSSLSRRLRLRLFHFGRSDIGFSIGHIQYTFSVTCIRRIILHPSGGRWQFAVLLPRLLEWCLRRSRSVFCGAFGAHIMERAPSEGWKTTTTCDLFNENHLLVLRGVYASCYQRPYRQLCLL